MYARVKKNIFYLSGIIIIIAFSCAVVRKPEGGPKDYTPPKMVSSDPQLNTVNFNKKRVILSFDEFIQLKDVQKWFVISPPFKKRVIPALRGNNKDILLEFNDDLKPNTTYTLNFGNSIVDLHEGNPLPNFTFSFSTGSMIDSLSITGMVVDAFNHLPEKEGIFVMLYPVANDSTPRKTLPSYIAKTNAKGWFTIPHVLADTFLVFALKDANMNFMFDQPGETIAFSDTMIVLDQSYYQSPDTTLKNIIFSDSLKVDSIDFYAGKKPQVELYFFKEDHKKQKFIEYSRLQPNHFILTFELPADSLGIELIGDKQSVKPWFIKDNILVNDTMSYWITDTTLQNKDTLVVKLTYVAPDSLNNLQPVHDTIKLIFKKPATKAKRASFARSIQKMTIACSSSKKVEVDLNEQLFLESNLPVGKFLPDKIMLTIKEDTLQIPVKYQITKDSVYLRRFNLSFPFVPNAQYQLVIDTLAFTSIYGQNHDSTAVKFKTRNDDYYGTLSVNLKNISGPVILQLLNGKGQMLEEKYIHSEGIIMFNFLHPGKYGLKVIYDTNGNQVWDTGNWGLHRQPEKVEYYKGDISIRSNWEIETSWEIPPK